MNPYQSPEVVQAQLADPPPPEWLVELWRWIKALLIVEGCVLFSFFVGWACQGFPIPWKPFGP